jgi:hypothetical protein
MPAMRFEWPLMLRSTHREVQLENFTLRSALRDAQEELRKHRLLISGLRAGQEDATKMFENVMANTKS